MSILINGGILHFSYLISSIFLDYCHILSYNHDILKREQCVAHTSGRTINFQIN